MSVELLDCPMCGSYAVLGQKTATGHHFVKCASHECRIRSFDFGNVGHAIETWNRRTHPAEQAVEVIGVKPIPQDFIDALRAVNKYLDFGDAIYRVKDRAPEVDIGYDGNMWEAPSVIAYGKAVEVINKYLKESP